MKTAILAGVLALATAGANAQTTTPGYDRPSTSGEHQRVSYGSDSMDHYSVSVQTAADAYSAGDLHEKKDDQKAKRHDHKKHTRK